MIRKFIYFSLILPLFISSCSSPPEKLARPTAPLELRVLTSCDELHDAYVESFVESSIYNLDQHIELWKKDYPIKASNLSKKSYKITSETLKQKKEIGNGVVVSTGETTYVASENYIEIIQTWPPDQLKRKHFIDLRKYLRTYKKKYKNLSQLYNTNSKMGKAPPNDTSTLSKKIADKIVFTYIYTLNNKLVVILDITHGDWKSLNIDNINGIEEGARVIVFDITKESQPKLLSVTDYPGHFTEIENYKNKRRATITFPWRKKLALLYENKYNNNVSDIYRKWFYKYEKYMNKDLGLLHFLDENRNEMLRVKLREEYIERITPEMVRDALPHRYQLDEDLSVKSDTQLFDCHDLITQPLETDTPLTTLVELRDEPKDEIVIFNKAVASKSYITYQTEDQWYLTSLRQPQPGKGTNRDDELFHLDSQLNIFDIASNHTFQLKQEIFVKGVVSDNYTPYFEENQLLQIVSHERNKVPIIYVSNYKKENEKYKEHVTIRANSVTHDRFIPNFPYFPALSPSGDYWIYRYISPQVTPAFKKIFQINLRTYLIPINQEYFLTLNTKKKEIALHNIDSPNHEPITLIKKNADLILFESIGHNKNAIMYDEATARLLLPYIPKYEDTISKKPKGPGYYIYELQEASGLHEVSTLDHYSILDIQPNQRDQIPHKVEFNYDINRKGHWNYVSLLFEGDESKDLHNEHAMKKTPYIYTFTPAGLVITDINGNVINKLKYQIFQ